MEDYKSKYSGEQVDALLDQVANGGTSGGGGGGVAVEVDPIFSASAAAGITASDIAGWNNKVDKVSGKGLSTEDFTVALKQKLEGLSNYDDTELSDAVETLRGDFDELVSGDTTTAIKTFNEVIAFLDGIQDSQDLSSIIASIEQQIAGKQDKLVSGTNIKTINGTSILGSGNIVIEGGSGGGSSSGGGKEVVYTSDETLLAEPNKVYISYYPGAAGVRLTIDFAETDAIYEEFNVVFMLTGIGGESDVSLVLPDNLKWPNGVAPTPEADKWMELNVVKIDADGDVTWNAVLTIFE